MKNKKLIKNNIDEIITILTELKKDINKIKDEEITENISKKIIELTGNAYDIKTDMMIYEDLKDDYFNSYLMEYFK